MDAPADYSAAVRALTRNLPAYVSYTIHSAVNMAGEHEDTQRVTVRTSDGKVVKGKRPYINVNSDTKRTGVRDVPFDPKCYTATAARATRFEGRDVEQLDLRPTCHNRSDPDEKGDQEFTRLYVDRVSHVPLAAVGDSTGDRVAVALDQHFTRSGDYVVPSSFRVAVKGSGFMFWLNFVVHEEFSNYTFSNTAP